MLRGICRYCLTAARWSERRRNGTWSENICTVCGGIKHGGCFLLTHCTLPSQPCIYSRLPAWSLNLPPPSQSLDIQGRETSKMMKWRRNRDREACEKLVKNVIALLSPALPVLFIHKGPSTRRDVLIFTRIVIDLVGWLIQLVPAEGNVVPTGDCRSVSK